MEKLSGYPLTLFWRSLSDNWKHAFAKAFDFWTEPDAEVLSRIINTKDFSLNGEFEPEEILDVQDLSPLKYLVDLQHVMLNHTYIDSFQPLSKLKHLKSLMLSDCELEDSSSLGGLKNLEDLYISNVNLGDISYFSKLTNLKKLTLIETSVTSLDALYQCTSLESLNYWGESSSDQALKAFQARFPNCEINELKKSMELADFLNSNPDADMEDFGFEVVSFEEEKPEEKWDYENAPEAVREHMDEIRYILTDILGNKVFPEEYGRRDVKNIRFVLEIESIEYFIIANYIRGEAKMQLIDCEHWSYWVGD